MATARTAGPRASASGGSKQLMGWLGIAGLIIVVDQLTKILVERTFAYGERVSVLPFFDFTLLYNKGAAFSFLAGGTGWQRWFFTVIGVGAAALIIWLLSKHGHQRMFSWAITLILGGALGNVIDRMIHGHVIDFLLFYYDKWYFPAFNIADTAITVGAVLMIVDELRRVRKAR